MTSFRLFDYILFGDFGYPNIIELSPLLLISIIDEGVVMTSGGISIMHTN
jgi:hypothetical protein